MANVCRINVLYACTNVFVYSEVVEAAGDDHVTDATDDVTLPADSAIGGKLNSSPHTVFPSNATNLQNEDKLVLPFPNDLHNLHITS